MTLGATNYPADLDHLLQVLRGAGEPTRLRLLAILRESELSVSEITHVLRQSQPRVSRHLKLLADAGLVTRFREGSWVFYRLETRGEAGRLVSALLEFLPVKDPVLVRDRERLDEVRAERAAAAAAYFSAQAPHWDEVRALYVPEADVEAAVRAMIGPGPLRLAIDMGTGTGRMLELLAGVCDTAVGYDISHDMLNVARANLERQGLSNCHVRHGDILSLPEANGAADLVILHQVLHFLDDPRAAVVEAGRLLAPGGRLIVVDFAPHEVEFLRDSHAHRRLGFPRAEMQQFVTDAGLRLTAERDLPPAPGSRGQLTVSIWQAEKPDPARVPGHADSSADSDAHSHADPLKESAQ